MTAAANPTGGLALNQTYTVAEWYVKYHGLKRNFDSVSRICKEKCMRISELQNQLVIECKNAKKYVSIKQDFDTNTVSNKVLQKSAQELTAKITHLEKEKTSLSKKLKSYHLSLNENRRINIDLESTIDQQIRKLSAMHLNERKSNANLLKNETEVKLLTKEKSKLNEIIAKLKSEIQALTNSTKTLDISIIQKDNIILLSNQKYDNLQDEYKETHESLLKIGKEYSEMKEKYQDITSKYNDNQMEIKVLENRLDINNDGGNKKEKQLERMKSLHNLMKELEEENKCNRNTISNLSKIQTEFIQLTKQYKELKLNSESIEKELRESSDKYTQLYDKFQLKNESCINMRESLDESHLENAALKQDLKLKISAFEHLNGEYQKLHIVYIELQNQHKSYLHSKHANMNNMNKMNEREVLLKNDLSRMVLENEEWMKKYNEISLLKNALNDDFMNMKNECSSYKQLYTDSQKCHEINLLKLKELANNNLKKVEMEKKVLSEKLHEKANEIARMECRPYLSVNEYTLLTDKETEFANIVTKFLVSEMSCEPFFTCLVCNSYFMDPVTCQPCGHSYCKQCMKKENKQCIQCQSKNESKNKNKSKVNKPSKYFENEILRSLTDKFKLRVKTYLPRLQQIADRKTNVIQNVI